VSQIKITDKNGQEWEFDDSKAVYRKSIYGCAIHKNKVLLVMDPRSDKWEIPGGGIDEGETDQAGLIREIKEETGLEADLSQMTVIDRVFGYFKSVEHDFPWKTDRTYCQISIKNPEGPILLNGNGDDVSKCQWVDIDNLDSLDIAKVDLSMIKKVLNV
jgi:8-oxo-dGTP pyrophosphatase MutT (NUDIX family)